MTTIEAPTLFDLIRAELAGDAAARDWLEQDVRAWRDGLVEMIQDVDAQFTRRKAEADDFQLACRALPSAEGQFRWRAFAAEWGKWKGSAMGFKKLLVAKLRDVKEIIHQDALGEPNPHLEALRDIQRRLGRIEAHLGIDVPA